VEVRGRDFIIKAKRLSVLLLAVVFLIIIYSSDRSEKVDMEVFLTSIKLNKTSFKLKINESQPIFATAVYSDDSQKNIMKESNYSTSNASVVAVDNSGTIIGVGVGSANITVKYKEFAETVSITVSDESFNINVKDYGAYGDGRHDDTKSFQQAIDDLAANGGGDVFVPAGTYILQPIFLKPNINLIGENSDTVILKLSNDAPDDYTRLITMDNNTKIQSITCDGNYQNHPNGTEHMHCIFASDKNNLIIEDNTLMNAVGDGISISGSKKNSNYIVISNNTILENQRSQIVIEQANHLLISNNTISSKTGRPGIHFEPWEKMQFYNAVITKNTIVTNSNEYCVLLAGSDSGMAGKSSSGYFFHGIEFSQNSIEGPFCSLLIMDTAGAKVYKNTLYVSDVFVWRKNEDLSVYNNEIRGTNGIRMEGGENGQLVSNRTVIYENTIRSAVDGINITAGAKNTTISDNKFSGLKDGAGVHLFASDDIVNTIVSNNTFKNYFDGVKASSIRKTYIDRLTVTHNDFSDNDGYAMTVQGESHHVKMDSNVITNTSGVFLLLEQAMSMSDISITNNKITGGKRGIYQSQSGKGSLDGLTISGNRISNTTGEKAEGARGAAIEFDIHSNPHKNVSIKENMLRNNAVNEILIPDSLLKSVKDNRIN